MKKISVIVPNYNHAPYLRERIDSILAQDYPEKEIILLDDASTDGSLDILREYADRPQVKALLRNEINSHNPFVQWQRGLAEATGDYVWIAESDDAAEPQLLTRLVAALEQNDAVLAFCQSLWIDGEGREVARKLDARWKHDMVAEGNRFVRQNLLGYCTICNASAVVFRRDAAVRVDMAQVAQFTASGDRLFWIELALQGRVAYIADRLNRFRQHTDKVSGGAEYIGLNIMQDHDIYTLVAPRLALTTQEQYAVCGYHWKAMHRPTVSPEGRLNAYAAWAQEPLFGRLAYLMYLVQRAKERC